MDNQIKYIYEQIKTGKLSPEDAAKQLRLLETNHNTPYRAMPGNDTGELLREKTVNYFKRLLGTVLKLPAHRIDADAALEKYGIDSIMAMQLTNELEKHFGSLSKTLFFEYRNIRELADYFLKSHRQQLPGVLEPENPKPEPAGEPVFPVGAAGPDKTGNSRRRRWRNPVFPMAQGAGGARESASGLDIAIIGLSGRYPKAGNVQEFWNNLRNGRDCITEIPKDRWDHSLYYDGDKNRPGKTYSKWGGFLEGVDRFDPLFFNISPREAEIMDPQERLFLECVFETLEDAGYTRNLGGQQGIGGSVGVYVGVMYEEYQLYGAQGQIQGRPVALPGNPSSIANRVSYFCDFHGPSLAVDTMCSSSLMAIHLACRSLERGECKLAIAGGVNVSIHPNKYLLLAQGKFTSSKGRCESFGEGGDGYVPGEGVGAVLLKPLANAVYDGDHIYGVIKGTAVNHGGKTNGYTVPNPNAQAEVIGLALKESGIDPRTISYIEAHGTGTSLGDPIEITGLTKAFREYTKDNQFCAIGSAKSNIGHCESAAGIAGLTKVLLQFKYGQLVPSIHSEKLNPNIDFINSPFIVQRNLEKWQRPVVNGLEFPRRAGISSFGAGGSNAHIVVEEYRLENRTQSPVFKYIPYPASPLRVIIVLSAKNESGLKELARRLLDAISRREITGEMLADVAYTLQTGREPMAERLGVVVGSLKELEEKLAGFINGRENIDGLYQGRVKHNQASLTVFNADEDLQKAVAAWIEKGKIGKLLELWVEGLIFDWNSLYGDIKPRRVSLPTYPFARERYWLPQSHRITEHSPEAGIGPGSAAGVISPADYEPVQSPDLEKLILVKDWEPKPAEPETDVTPGTVIVLGTGLTTRLAMALFKATAIQVIHVIQGESGLPGAIITDFYSREAGESLYQQVKARLNGQKTLGMIDLTAYDQFYEQSTEVETGKIAFLQKLIAHDRKENFILLQVTHRLNPFPNGKTTMQGARLAGLYRMLGAEYRQIQSITMDSDYSLSSYKKLAQQIQTEFLNPARENLSECCYRNNIRYEPRLRAVLTDQEIRERPDVPPGYQPVDVVLITGGTRGIGAAIAEHIVSQGIQNLVIMGREDLPQPPEWERIIKNDERPELAEKLKRLWDFTNRGVKVYYSAVSLADPAGIKAVIENVHQKLGPVTGVFHCAGLAGRNPVFLEKSPQDIEAVCEPKIKGLVNLHKAVENEPLDFFIAFSSISGIIPSVAAGQSDYAAANAYMDYYATHQNTQGRSYFKSIQWSAWGETGMAAGRTETPAFMKTGLAPLLTADGLDFLDIIRRMPYAVSMPCIATRGEFDYGQLLKTEIVPGKVKLNNKPRKSGLGPAPLPGETASTDIRAAIAGWLRQVFTMELKLTAEQLDMDKPLDEYGIDSIIVYQLMQPLQEKVNQTLPPSLLFEYNSLAALTGYFAANHARAFSKEPDPPAGLMEEAALQQTYPLMNHVSFHDANTELHPNKPVPIYPSPAMSAPGQSNKDIAVIGLSCRLPGAPTKEAYWDLLTKGLTAIRPLTEKRWISAVDRRDYGGWLDDIDRFDPKFFHIDERDAAVMDPQARILLEESLRAICDAGYEFKELAGQKVGVYVGGRLQPNMNALFQAPNLILGVGQNYLAANISRFFNLKGPSMVVDTACSSGITGLLLAADSLREMRVDMALVGAVNLLLSPFTHDIFAARNILSKNGEFHIFDKRASGEVLGEGAGFVMLKRLDDAVKDGNQIYGVIKAIAPITMGGRWDPDHPISMPGNK